MKFKKALKKAVAKFDDEDFLNERREEDPTMLKHMPQLQEINRHGYLTTNSQAGRRARGKHYQTGRPYEIHERAYISGFMQKKLAEKFIKQMGITTDKCVVYLPECDNKVGHEPQLDLPLTVSHYDGKINVDTHHTMAMITEYYDLDLEYVELDKSKNVVHIFCVDLKWNRLASGKNGLFTQVLDTLEKMTNN